MELQTALFVVTWAAIVLLYLGLAAVLRELRLLRQRVAEETASGTQFKESAIRLPAELTAGRPRVVVAAESGCPLCRVVLHELGVAATAWAVRPILLTYEPATQWSDVSAGFDLVRDDRAWSAIAHLSPPALMLVDANGLVKRIKLPANEQDVRTTLDAWGAESEMKQEKIANVA